MYIRKEDFNYFKSLHNGLDEVKRRKFLEIIEREASNKMGGYISKIQVVGNEIYDERGFEPGEMITRTMIKKAYKQLRG